MYTYSKQSVYEILMHSTFSENTCRKKWFHNKTYIVSESDRTRLAHKEALVKWPHQLHYQKGYT